MTGVHAVARLVLVCAVVLVSGIGGLAGLAKAPQPEGALGTAFTYQGRLTDNGSPAEGAYDFQFKLYDAFTGGNLLGTVTPGDVPVSGGLFTVRLNFGSGPFSGDARWLEIGVRPGDSSGAYTLLDPRQELTPSPYALALPGLWTQQNGISPNLIGGYSGNWTTAGVTGAVIGGGGDINWPNRVTDRFGTVGGGQNNQAGDGDGDPAGPTHATVGGGWQNIASGSHATVGGGANNIASDNDATVAGGHENSASANLSTVGGGQSNQAGGDSSTVGGGGSNIASGDSSTIGGGGPNIASGRGATIAGGISNTVTVECATVGGGYDNVAGGDFATVGGGAHNVADENIATVAGGHQNTASGQLSTVGGGQSNQAMGNSATVGGGSSNTASGGQATVGGGIWNTASGGQATIGGGGWNVANGGDSSTVGGGYYNAAGGDFSTVGGGGSCVASGSLATVAGGHVNTASGTAATVGGGENNSASGEAATVGGGGGNSAGELWATVAGGADNSASGSRATVSGGTGNTASGDWATIAGGANNTASGDYATVGGGNISIAQGDYSFVAGHRAKAYNGGCFVWGDSSAADITCDNDNRWVARASGGVYFYTDSSLTTGSYLAAGGTSWQVISDRATKENFSPADGQAILETLASLPVQEYNLKSQNDSIRHVGLVAQDFAAFGYGESDEAINLEDADGVALAAIQGLYAENQALKAEVAAQQQQLDEVTTRLAALEKGQAPARSGGLPLGWLAFGGVAVAAGLVIQRRPRGGGR